MDNRTKMEGWEVHWARWMAKLARIDELKALGRYGYQLRMPRRSAEIAYAELVTFCADNNIEMPNL